MNAVLRLLLNLLVPDEILFTEVFSRIFLKRKATKVTESAKSVELQKDVVKQSRLLSRKGFQELVESPLVSRVLEVGQKLTPENISNFFASTPQRLIATILTAPGKVTEDLSKLTTEQRRVLGNAIEASARQEGSDAQSLSSSWITFGVYEPVGLGTSGFLTITTVQGKSYTYPGVSLFTWQEMKAAKGRDGSGAGTVFWATYLRGFKGSVGGIQTSAVFQTALGGLR